VIDRTEAMTVVDVNTGKFTGSGGNLEETVTKNNLEAAEEIVRQLRLRDIGGIIVVDFIDMVLESNRDLVLRRLVECLGRDRTRHQVAEVTSLGLVQMTRKRIGTGLLEAFSENCDHCAGRGVIVRDAPVEPRRTDDGPRAGGRKSRGGRGRGDANGQGGQGGDRTPAKASVPSPRDVAAMARAENAERPAADEEAADAPEAEVTPDEPVAAAAIEEMAQVVEEAAPVLADAARVAEEPTAEVVEEAPQPTPTTSKVVTRTRRRAASRPAGPPSVAAEQPAGGGPGTEGDDAGVSLDDAPHVEHVPIKKRGARKR